jgi:arylsulfatase A-like enzyme
MAAVACKHWLLRQVAFEATIAEVLGERGFNTYMVGKWHLTAEDEMNLASRKTTGRSDAASSASMASSALRPTSGIPISSTTTTRSTSPTAAGRAAHRCLIDVHLRLLAGDSGHAGSRSNE